MTKAKELLKRAKAELFDEREEIIVERLKRSMKEIEQCKKTLAELEERHEELLELDVEDIDVDDFNY